MSLLEIVLIALIAAAVFFALRSMFRKRKSGCSCCCASCGSACREACGKQKRG